MHGFDLTQPSGGSPLDPSEWICCIVLTPASLNLPLLPRQYGGHMGTIPTHSSTFRSILPFRWEILWSVDCFAGFSFFALCQELKPWCSSQLSKRKLPVDPLLCQKDAKMPAGAGSNALANWLHSMSCFPGRRSLGEI